MNDDLIKRLQEAEAKECWACGEYEIEDDCECQTIRPLLDEAAAEIKRLRTRLAMNELVRLSEELGLYELDADDAE